MTRSYLFSLSAILTLQAACAEEALPPYVPLLNSGDAAADASTADGGLASDGTQIGISTQEMIDDLQAWGADLGDQDKVCVNFDFSCAIDKQGRAKCWGADSGGKSTPPDGLPPLVQITCGEYHACALGDDGTIACWGMGTKKELVGDSPVEQGQSIVPQGKFKEVSARGSSTCAIDMSDRIVCWGAGSPDSAPEFPNFGQSSPPIGTYKGISAGEVHACAIELDTGRVVCWGAGASDGGCFPTRNYHCGQAEGAPGPFVEVASGEQHSCALREDGTIACWGVGKTGEMCDPGADNNMFDCGQAKPPDGAKERFVRIRAGWQFTCGITDEYKLHCWGYKDSGLTKPRPGKYSQVAAGGSTHVCAIGLDGVVSCWGGDSSGDTSVPKDIPGK